MTRRAGLGISILAFTLVAGTGGWWYAQREAEKEVRQLIMDADLADKISYEDVSYNPITGKLTVHSIRPVHSVPGNVKVDALEIIDFDQQEDIYTRLHVRAVGLRMDLVDAAREQSKKDPSELRFGESPFEVFDHPLQALVAVGCQNLTAYEEADYRYYPDEAKIKVSISFGASEMGKTSRNLSLAGIKPKTIRTIREMTALGRDANNVGALAALGDISYQLRDVEQISLSDFSLSYEESGLVERLKQYYVRTRRLPDEAAQFEISKEHIQQAVGLGVPLGLSDSKIRSSLEAVSNFFKDPKFLRLKIDGPIPLMKYLFSRTSGLDFLKELASSASISNE